MIFFLIIFVLATFALLTWVIYKMEEVDERQEELDKYSVHLDERANKLAQWEQELIRWEDVKEIVNLADAIITPTSREFPVCWANEEDYYKDILHKLRDENDVPPPIEERYPGVLACAELACGNKLTDSRERENILIRSFVAYKLHEEGYSYSEIGKMLKRDHSTVTNLVHRVRDMLSIPYAYKTEVAKYNEFEKLV